MESIHKSPEQLNKSKKSLRCDLFLTLCIYIYRPWSQCFWWVLVLVIEYLDKKLIKSFHELILPVMFRYFGVWTTVEDVA